MATPKTVRTYTLNGTLKDFTIPFEYLARKFVVVTLIGTNRRELILNTDYRFSTPTQITTLRGTGWGTGDGYDLIEIRRFTSATDRLVDFADGSILRAYDLNTAQIQSLHIAEEARDLTADTIGVNNDGDLDARARKIVNLADGVNDGDAVNMRQQKSWADTAYNWSIASGQSAAASEVSRQASLAQANIATTQAGLANTARIASEAARDLANTYKGNALTSANASEASNVRSQEWSAKAEDVVVTGGLYSSYHYSRKAAASASTATTQAGLATTNGAAQVALAAAQVTLATAQAGTATTKAADAATSAAQAATSSTQVQYGTVPLFMVDWWNGKRSAIPAGYIPADGQAISRSLYTDVTANVVAMMGTITDASWVATNTLRGNWATGDGSTTWRVPDLNGKSAGTVGAPFLRGDGTLSAAVAGTIQLGQIESHTHTFVAGAAAARNTYPSTIGWDYTKAGAGYNDISTAVQIAPTGGNETRPLNVTGCWIIKVFGAVNNTGSVDANQIVTTLGIQDSRIAALEGSEKKVYLYAQLLPAWGTPTGPARCYWDAPLITAGGIVYDTSGAPNNWFVLPVGGVYRVKCAFLSGGPAVACAVQLGVSKAGVISYPVAGYAPTSVTTLGFEFIGRFATGDKVFAYLSAGQLYGPQSNYHTITIERIDN